MVLAYLWHAFLEFCEERGLLDEWLKKHPRLRHGVFLTGSVLLLAPAAYYGSVLFDVLNPALI
jgi:hypothetical protein